MPEVFQARPGVDHAQLMRQKERELMRELQAQLQTVVHPPTATSDIPVVEETNTVQTTVEEQRGIQAWLKSQS